MKNIFCVLLSLSVSVVLSVSVAHAVSPKENFDKLKAQAEEDAKRRSMYDGTGYDNSIPEEAMMLVMKDMSRMMHVNNYPRDPIGQWGNWVEVNGVRNGLREYYVDSRGFTCKLAITPLAAYIEKYNSLATEPARVPSPPKAKPDVIECFTKKY